jgi:hypothetical protein
LILSFSQFPILAEDDQLPHSLNQIKKNAQRKPEHQIWRLVEGSFPAETALQESFDQFGKNNNQQERDDEM